jgi:hypothetical protein
VGVASRCPLWRALSFVAALASAWSASAQGVADVITIPNVVVPEGATSARVPVFLRDVAGTPVGSDQPPGYRIADILFNVVFGPNPCIEIVEPYFDKKPGVLSKVTPVFETSLVDPHKSFALLYAAYDGDLPLTGADDELGELVFSLKGCGPGPIYLVFDESLTLLGSVYGASEQASSGTLALVTGSIAEPGVPVPTPTISLTPITATFSTSTPTATPTATPTWDPRVPTYTATSTPTRTETPTPTQTRTRRPTPTVTPTYDPRFPTPTPEYVTSGGPAGGSYTPPPTPVDLIAIPNMTLSSRATFVRVPIYLQDVHGTPLGRGYGEWPGPTITGVEIDVKYGPNSCIDTVAPYFDTSEGILAGLAPDRVERPRVSHVSQGFVYHVDESAGLIPFYSDYPPGDKIGDLVFALSGCTSPIYLDIGAGTTLLRGTELTETASTKTLDLWSGSFGFGSLAPTRTPGAPGAETATATPTPDRTPDAGIGDPVPIPGVRPAGLVLLGCALAAAGLVLGRRLRG